MIVWYEIPTGQWTPPWEGGVGVVVGSVVATGIGVGVAVGAAVNEGDGVADHEGLGVGTRVGSGDVTDSTEADGLSDVAVATSPGSRSAPIAIDSPMPAMIAPAATAVASAARLREPVIPDQMACNRLMG